MSDDTEPKAPEGKPAPEATTEGSTDVPEATATADDAPEEQVSAAATAGEAGDEPSRPQAEAAPRPARSGFGWGELAASFSLPVAVIAAGVAGFLWWQYRAFYVDLSESDIALNRDLEQLRASSRREADSIESIVDLVEENRGATATLGDELDDLQPTLVQLAQRIDALQGGSFDSRALWLRAEAEFYLATANTELDVAGHWENAITALVLADDLLRELANPALNSVRGAIADELTALRAVRLPDTQGLAYTLASLAGRVDGLPMRADNPENFRAAPADLDEVEPGLGRLVRGLREALLGIVRVERRDAPVGVVLTNTERRIVRRQLELELGLARAALAGAQDQAFRVSLEAAEELLRREFDRGASEVASALDTLEAMRRLDIAPQRPDISRSLNLLRAAPRDNP